MNEYDNFGSGIGDAFGGFTEFGGFDMFGNPSVSAPAEGGAGSLSPASTNVYSGESMLPGAPISNYSSGGVSSLDPEAQASLDRMAQELYARDPTAEIALTGAKGERSSSRSSHPSGGGFDIRTRGLSDEQRANQTAAAAAAGLVGVDDVEGGAWAGKPHLHANIGPTTGQPHPFTGTNFHTGAAPNSGMVAEVEAAIARGDLPPSALGFQAYAPKPTPKPQSQTDALSLDGGSPAAAIAALASGSPIAPAPAVEETFATVAPPTVTGSVGTNTIGSTTGADMLGADDVTGGGMTDAFSGTTDPIATPAISAALSGASTDGGSIFSGPSYPGDLSVSAAREAQGPSMVDFAGVTPAAPSMATGPGSYAGVNPTQASGPMGMAFEQAQIPTPTPKPADPFAIDNNPIMSAPTPTPNPGYPSTAAVPTPTPNPGYAAVPTPTPNPGYAAVPTPVAKPGASIIGGEDTDVLKGSGGLFDWLSGIFSPAPGNAAPSMPVSAPPPASTVNSGVFGDVGSTFMDALADAFGGGSDSGMGGIGSGGVNAGGYSGAVGGRGGGSYSDPAGTGWK